MTKSIKTIGASPLKCEQVPVGEVVAWNHPTEERRIDFRFLRFDVQPGALLFTAPQKPVISKEKLCDWLEDNFDIDDSHRDTFAACFANYCNCIVESGGDQ